MDALLSDYVSGVLELDTAGLEYSSHPNHDKPELLPHPNTFSINDDFIGAHPGEDRRIDYGAGLELDEDLFGEGPGGLCGGALEEELVAAPAAVQAPPSFALPPVIADTQTQAFQLDDIYVYPGPNGISDKPEGQPAYIYPGPGGTTNEPEGQPAYTWDPGSGYPTYTDIPGWVPPAQPKAVLTNILNSKTNGKSSSSSSNLVKAALGVGTLPNQQLATPPYSQPPSQAPTRTTTPAPALAPLIVREKPLGRIPARHRKGETIDYAAYYDKLPVAPTSWGGNNPDQPKFQYTTQGMWKPDLTYTRKDLLEYMTARSQAGAPLTIWLQNCPAGSNARCPDRGTRQCRFRDCPASSRSILKGWWRVAFDEHPTRTGIDLDPFHCAGFMHLHCFEKCFDLIEMVKTFKVAPDTRQFEREEKNFMAMTRDHGDHILDYERWRLAQEQKYEAWQSQAEKCKRLRQSSPPPRTLMREDHLWHVLTMKHLEKESSARQGVRDARGGASIDKHQGDLDLYVSMKKTDRQTKADVAHQSKMALKEKQDREAEERLARAARENRRTVNKRSRDDDDADYEDGPVSPRTARARPIKRIRTRGIEERLPNLPSPGFRRSPRFPPDNSTTRTYFRKSC
ncbi:hypothetical protein ACHAQA_008082 [Verticillium albo-atrum]